MAEVQIDLNVRTEVRELQRLGADVIGIVTPAFQRGAAQAQEILQSYPPDIPDGYWARHSTRKMRAFWFAKLKREGKLRRGDDNARYRRTVTLGRRWLVDTQYTSTVVRVQLGNNTTYAPFVQDDQRQAGIHRERWTTDAQAIRTVTPHFVADVESTLRGALQRYTGR